VEEKALWDDERLNEVDIEYKKRGKIKRKE